MGIYQILKTNSRGSWPVFAFFTFSYLNLRKNLTVAEITAYTHVTKYAEKGSKLTHHHIPIQLSRYYKTNNVK